MQEDLGLTSQQFYNCVMMFCEFYLFAPSPLPSHVYQGKNSSSSSDKKPVQMSVTC